VPQSIRGASRTMDGFSNSLAQPKVRNPFDSGKPSTAVWCTITMIKKTLTFCVVALLLASVRLADAQQPGKVHRIGFLRASVPPGGLHGRISTWSTESRLH